MVIQRAKGKTSSEDKNAEENGSSKISAIQSRQTRKQKLLQEQRFHEKLRWLLVLLLIVISTIALYYYFSYYQLDSTPLSRPTRRETVAPRKPGRKAHKDQPTKMEKQKKKTERSRKEKKALKSKETRGGGGVNEQKASGRRQDNAPTGTFEKLKNRVLRQPIPGGDVDRPHIMELLTADNLLVEEKYGEALEKFNAILKVFPQSPRSLFGKGITLSYMAAMKKSNKLMDTAINFFRMAGLDSVVASDTIRVPALVALADKAHVRGDVKLELRGMEKLVELRPQSVVYANQLGMLYLAQGNLQKAKRHFRKCIKMFENNYFASAQLGVVIFTEKQYEQALPLLMEGIRQDPDVKGDGRFYNYAGEALTRLNRSGEALALYGEGVALGLFPSVWQRSLVNEPGLRALPWWSVDVTGYVPDIARIESQVDAIASEALSLFDKEKLVFVGEDGKRSPHFVLFSKGKKDFKNCQRAPQTCALLEAFPEAVSCRRGTIKFSSLPLHTHIAPHVGLTNTKLQILVGLDVDPQGGIRIRVAQDIKVLGNRQIGVIDESFEKEVWHVGKKAAIFMTVDVWHPDLHEEARRQSQPF